MIATTGGSIVLDGLPPTFRQWQKRCDEQGVPPVIAVAGSRGKSTVVRLLQAIFDHAGVQSAIWTDLGVEINGRRQTREIAGWNRALRRLTGRSLDVAVQELDWSMVSAVGLPRATYPISAITNICNNDQHCERTPRGVIAQQALPRVVDAIHPAGFICANGDDYALQQVTEDAGAVPIIVAKSDAAPLLHQHRDASGISLWIDENDVIIGGADADGEHMTVANVQDIPLSLDGTASFELTNVLVASAAALATGVGPAIIREALTQFRPSTTQLPGSFSVRQVGSIDTIVDQVMPSWFLKPVLRAANPHSSRRQITVIGSLASIPDKDIPEVGRLLGRAHGAVIHHGEEDSERIAAFRHGIAHNDYPPVLVGLPTERRAINRALRAMRAHDVVLFLADDDPGPALRAVARMRP